MKGLLSAAARLIVYTLTCTSLAAAVLAVERGARIVRVHDVAATKDALAVWAAMEGRNE